MTLKKHKLGTVRLTANPEGIVVLTSTIGDAQIGGNVVYLDDQIIAKGAIQNLGLGTAIDLSKRTLRIVTNVLDVNPATNKISVTHFFYNADPALHLHTDTVVNDGDVYSLTRTYKFD